MKENQIRAATQQLFAKAKANPRQWPQLFADTNSDELLTSFTNRRQVLLSLVRSLNTSEDQELAQYVCEQEIKFFEKNSESVPEQIANFRTFSAPLQICCFILSRFHNVNNIWRAIKVSQQTKQPIRTEYLYTGGLSPSTSMKDTLTCVTRCKEGDKRNLKEEILKQIKVDEGKGMTQQSVDNFWQETKHKGWKTELMLDVDDFSEEIVTDIDPEEFLDDMLRNTEKWEKFLSYRHTSKSPYNDANKLKRLLILTQITNHVDNIALYEELLEYLYEQECLFQASSYCGISGSLHALGYLFCCTKKLDNVLKIWKTKCVNPDAYFIQHADFLYGIGYTPDSKTTIADTIDYFSNKYKAKDKEEEELIKDLKKRFAYDGTFTTPWRTQERIETFLNKRKREGFWEFARLIDGGWG